MEESQLIITAVRLSAEGGVDRVFVARVRVDFVWCRFELGMTVLR